MKTEDKEYGKVEFWVVVPFSFPPRKSFIVDFLKGYDGKLITMPLGFYYCKKDIYDEE